MTPQEDPELIRAALAAGWVQRVLVARASRVGDTLHTLPTLALLRDALPRATIVFLCSDYAAPVARGAPVDRIVAYPHKGRGPSALLGRRRAVRELRSLSPFDLWLGLEDKPWGRRLAAQLGCRLWHSRSTAGTHVVERKAGVLAPLGLWDPGRAPPPIRWEPLVTDPPGDVEALPRPRVGLQTGSHARRLWRPPHRRRDPSSSWLSQLALELHQRLGASLAIHAGAGGTEARVARQVGRDLQRRGVPHTVLEGLSLDALGGALRGLDAFVSANTGPAHLAAALDVPVVLLEGPTPRDVAYPWRAEHLARVDLSLPCSPCSGTAHGRACKVPRCLDDIPPEQVVAQVRKLIR